MPTELLPHGWEANGSSGRSNTHTHTFHSRIFIYWITWKTPTHHMCTDVAPRIFMHLFMLPTEWTQQPLKHQISLVRFGFVSFLVLCGVDTVLCASCVCVCVALKRTVLRQSIWIVLWWKFYSFFLYLIFFTCGYTSFHFYIFLLLLLSSMWTHVARAIFIRHTFDLFVISTFFFAPVCFHNILFSHLEICFEAKKHKIIFIFSMAGAKDRTISVLFPSSERRSTQMEKMKNSDVYSHCIVKGGRGGCEFFCQFYKIWCVRFWWNDGRTHRTVHLASRYYCKTDVAQVKEGKRESEQFPKWMLTSATCKMQSKNV